MKNNQNASTPEGIILNFNIENMNGTQKEAENFASTIQNKLRRERGLK